MSVKLRLPQFTADAFRHFIIRTLTDDIPPDGVEKEIARIILRHPAFNGGWLLFLAAEIHEKSRTHDCITVTVSVDKYLSWMDIAGILQFNRALSALHNHPAAPLAEFSLRKRRKQLHLCLCSLRFFYVPPVFIQNKRRKSIVVHINKITYPPVNSLS
ncbi:hypothetical protein JV532_005172 [Escherichia coli]|nr:hypothetical protein [Escherichia coli]